MQAETTHEFALRALVAAGHVSQANVDLALAIAEGLLLPATQPPAVGVDEAAMESWHSAIDDAGELFANAPDERYASRASRLVTWIKANRPTAALRTGGGES